MKNAEEKVSNGNTDDAKISVPGKKEKSRKRKIAGHVGTGVTLLIAAFLIFFIIVQVSGPYAGIKVFGFKTYLISDTKSMEPMLQENDFIVVKKADFDSLEVDDIITFMGVIVVGGKAVNAPVTHKIIEVIVNETTGERSYRTKGINQSTNPTPDTRLVTKNGTSGTNKYIGQYAFKVRWLGKVIAFLKSPFGIGALVVNLIIIIAIVYILKHSKDDSGNDGKKPLADTATADGAATPAEEGKAEFTVILKESGANKINVIKVVREITGLGLAEAKAIVDGTPGPVKENITKDAASEIANKLKQAGAVVELNQKF